MKAFVSGRPYWWQWFTILSLDATAVALAWQAIAFRISGTPQRAAHAVVLGASVWLAYTADRWIEGWRLSPEQACTQRHYFAVRWRWPLLAVWLVIFVSDVTIAFAGLTRREFAAGLVLLAAVAAYLFLHQLLQRDRLSHLPKEICVAALMVGGATVFPLADPVTQPLALAPMAAGFALLCFANCASISLWEDDVDRTQGQFSLALQFRRAAPMARLFPWVLALAAAAAAGLQQPGWSQRALACIGISSALLGWVDLQEERLGRQLARVLADAVLLTPLIALVFRR